MSVRASLLAALVVGSRLTLAAAPAALAAPAAPAVAPAADPVTPEATTVPVGAEPDGTPVRLDVSVWPQTSGKHPVVLLAHGFGGTKDSVTSQANELHDRGYVVIAWSARGHGQSGGRIHLNDPAYEIADARTLLDLAAKRSDVELDAPGDPRAGVMGASYGGALGLMLAGSDRRVDGGELARHVAHRFDAPGRNRVQRGSAERLAGAEAETGMMPRAAEGIADNSALLERSAVMRADRADG